MSLLPPQEEVFWSDFRTLYLLWRRQMGKSHLFASKALSRMMLRAGHSVFVVNASLLMGQENILKEVNIWAAVLDAFRAVAAAADMELKLYETDYSEKGELKRAVEVDRAWDVETLAGLFESSKLETRLWHDRQRYSRTRVVAPNPLTARGFTGDVFGDEIAFWPEFEAVMDAVEPIIARNPQYIMWMATTPAADETHATFGLLMPQHDRFDPNPRGNWYKTEDGTPVHRVDAWDGEAAGVPLYDSKTGAAMTVAEARVAARNKKSFDRNFLLKFISGGAAAIPRHLLLNAQAVDDGECGLALDLGELSRLEEAA
ncbi:MAG: hypothetical protein V4726_11225 [Verrucomicrobiota bacterium]